MPLSREAARLNALRQLNLLDTDPSESFDRITRMASQIFGLPIAAVSLTDMDRQWFKSRVGVDHDSIPREKAPCAAVAESRDLLVIPDIKADACYADSHLGASGIRFYAGAPLVTRDGFGLGALCVLGFEPRTVTPDEIAALSDLAAMVMSQIELQHAFGRIDPISGLPNRNQFLDDLDDLARDRAGEERLAVLVDLAETSQLGNFLRVLGPSSVDDMVRESAGLVTSALGPGRTAYHVSTTQFAFLAYAGAIEDEYVLLLGSILDRMQAKSSVKFMMTGVIGVAPVIFGKTAPLDLLRALQGAADDARASSVSVGIHNPQLDVAHNRRFQLLQEFGPALEADDQLRLVYQPRIDLKSGRCIGAEALLRWQHPTLQAVSPGEFVPIIEHSSYALRMTGWVLRTAAAQLQRWQAQGLALQLSVNVSASNLQEPDFVERVLAIIEEHGLPTSSIELEITESAIIRDPALALDRLNALSAAGVKLAIDDFGTGYSSLSYLQRLPADVVKIDQSFVRDLGLAERERVLVRSMITLSHDLGFRVVGEGVESAEVAELLAEMGCEEAQGYHFAKPLEVADFERWIRRSPSQTQDSPLAA